MTFLRVSVLGFLHIKTIQHVLFTGGRDVRFLENQQTPPSTGGRHADEDQTNPASKWLVALIGIVGFGGYWLLQHHLDQFFLGIWNEILKHWQLFSIPVAIKAGWLWVKKMGVYWITKEIPKRIATGFALSYGIIYIMPLRQRILFRLWMKQKKKSFLNLRKSLLVWLRSDHVFGPHAGWALGLLITLIFLMLFYTLFWIWVIIAVGFIKTPIWIVTLFRSIFEKTLFFLEKIPFGKGLIKLTNVFWAYLARGLAKLRFWKQKSETQLQKQRIRRIRIVRIVILQRRRRERVWAAVKESLPRTTRKPTDATDQPHDP